MYRVYNGSNDLFNPSRGEAYLIEQGTLKLGINKAGEFEFSIPPTNAEYNNINLLTSRITINLNNETLFEGYPVEIGRDWNNFKSVRCVGQLAVLNDGILPGWGIGNTYMSSARTTPYEKFMDVNLQIYNSQVDSFKAVVLGECDFKYAKDYAGNDLTGASTFMSELNYKFPSFWEWLQMPEFLARSPLTNVFNGYIIPRYQGPRYSSDSMALTIDIKTTSGETSTQIIEFAKNLLNFEDVTNAEELITVVYPVGKYQDTTAATPTDRYFTIYPGDRTSADNCSDDYRNFVSASQQILDTFGRRVKSIIFDEIETPNNLTGAAQKRLQELVKRAFTINISAFDLSLINVNYSPIRPGQYFRVKSAPHGIDDYFQCSEITLDLLAPEQNEYVFGPTPQTLTKWLNRKI